jgi:hypothetical protein
MFFKSIRLKYDEEIKFIQISFSSYYILIQQINTCLIKNSFVLKRYLRNHFQ